MLPLCSHFIFFSFLYPFYIHSVGYNVLLWKVRFNELLKAMATWGTKCCCLTASGSSTIGWASALWSKVIKTETLTITALIHLLQATGTSTHPPRVSPWGSFFWNKALATKGHISTHCTGKYLLPCNGSAQLSKLLSLHFLTSGIWPATDTWQQCHQVVRSSMKLLQRHAAQLPRRWQAPQGFL